ncbi:MAG: helix-turn-helix transcriptional regulator [Ruminococcaceae bacterium]|nr:helix-turn-helix transcriptional regulator [Oscillospiraceae bacterium]
MRHDRIESEKEEIFLDVTKTGNLIKELRIEKGLTQKELAVKLNVSTAAVSKWENGKGFPDISILEPLSSELGISITELVNGKKTEENKESDSIAKDIIEISKKEMKFEKARQIFVVAAFLTTILLVNAFVIFDAVSSYKTNAEFGIPVPSILGLSMFLFGGNAIVFAIFNLILGNKISVQKALQIGLFSEACCAASVWMGSVYTNYKVSVNDISAVLDTAKGIELYSRMLFLITVLINVFAYWKIIKNK